MDNLSKVKAEIEKRIQEYNNQCFVQGHIKMAALQDLLSFIESLEKECHKCPLKPKYKPCENYTPINVPKIKGWVAREPNYKLYLLTDKPYRFGNMWDCNEGEVVHINDSIFPDLKWEDEPIEVELILNRV